MHHIGPIILIQVAKGRPFGKVLVRQLLPLEPMHGKLIGVQSEAESNKARQQQA
jgi:hypothetical protein